MATNKPIGNNARVGAVKGRTQDFNPVTGLWTKRDTQTGKFMDVKTSDNTPFKGGQKRKVIKLYFKMARETSPF